MRKERLELSRVTPLAPKASASTNSATFACQPAIIAGVCGLRLWERLRICRSGFAATTYCPLKPATTAFPIAHPLRFSINRTMSLFELAFPESWAGHKEAAASLRDAEDAGTRSLQFLVPEVARWLARRCPGELSIDWDELDDTSRLDELLARRSGSRPKTSISTAAGLAAATGSTWSAPAARGRTSTGSWPSSLSKRLRPFWTQLYDAAEIPLVWNLVGSRYSKARNALATVGHEPATRENGMRGRPRSAEKRNHAPAGKNADPIPARRRKAH